MVAEQHGFGLAIDIDPRDKNEKCDARNTTKGQNLKKKAARKLGQ